MINEGVIDPFFTHRTLSFDSNLQSHTQFRVYIVCVNTNWKFCHVNGIVCAQFGGDIVCQHNSEDTMRTLYIVCVNTNWKFCCGSGVVCAQFVGDIVCQDNSEDTMRTHKWIYLLGSF